MDKSPTMAVWSMHVDYCCARVESRTSKAIIGWPAVHSV